MITNTAILIFANSAEFEATQKSFPSSAQLFEALNAETLAVVKTTGLPFFHYSERDQIGTTFGQRFTNAILSVYDKGFENVITIGNDTPSLKPHHILRAVDKLQQNYSVLGPSTDGGFYLMGLKKSHFNLETFLKLPWQTSGLNRSISSLSSAQNIQLSYLEVLSDIDNVSDIKHIANSFRRISTRIKQLLHTYISVEKKIRTSHFIPIEIHIHALLFNKGSPQLLHL